VSHQKGDLRRFTTQEMTILWEHEDDTTSVSYRGIKARMIATVSPLLDQFIEFQKKGAKVLHMPCPSELHLRYMGLILRPIYLELINSDVEIQSRVKSLGPFISLVLNQDLDVQQQFIIRRNDELKKLNSSQLIEMVTQHQHVMVELGLESMEIRFHLYYVIFPFLKEDFAANSLRPSSVYQNVKNMPENFGGKFTFYALCPPKHI
jgi:hypothetical protein